MADLYLYDDVPVLRNSLGIKDENTLDRIEAEQSRANMMLLYERGFHDFTPSGLCEIHHFLFGDLYDWAGKYRIINIEKRERLLAGRSVWYSNDEEIPNDLESAFSALYQPNWDSLTREQFVSAISRCFPRIWLVEHLGTCIVKREETGKGVEVDDRNRPYIACLLDSLHIFVDIFALEWMS